MKKNFFLHSLPFRLLVGVAFGICIGLLLNITDESDYNSENKEYLDKFIIIFFFHFFT